MMFHMMLVPYQISFLLFFFFSFFLLQKIYIVFCSSYVSICKDLQKTIVLSSGLIMSMREVFFHSDHKSIQGLCSHKIHGQVSDQHVLLFFLSTGFLALFSNLFLFLPPITNIRLINMICIVKLNSTK